jgi:hypothetical protein
VVRLKSQRRRQQAAQPAIDTKTCSFRNSIARYVQQVKHDPEAIFELRWSARIPLARPGGAGHDGKTSWYGSNRNGVADRLNSPGIEIVSPTDGEALDAVHKKLHS